MKAKTAKKAPPRKTKTMVEGNVQIIFEAVPQIEINHLLAAALAGMQRRYYANAPSQTTEQEGSETPNENQASGKPAEAD